MFSRRSIKLYGSIGVSFFVNNNATGSTPLCLIYHLSACRLFCSAIEWFMLNMAHGGCQSEEASWKIVWFMKISNRHHPTCMMVRLGFAISFWPDSHGRCGIKTTITFSQCIRKRFDWLLRSVAGVVTSNEMPMSKGKTASQFDIRLHQVFY